MKILMTGGTSGIGLEAVKRLAAAGSHDLTIAARAPDRAPATLASVARLVSLDLETLASVRAFITAMEGHTFDALLLNAGVQCVRPQTSKDGFELTFAVNHLAHYVLLRALAPRLNANGRVVLTSSDTHDPEQKTGIPAPRHADVMLLAHPERDPARDASPLVAGRRAYSSSKLCNAMMARELAKRLKDTRPDIMVAAYNPGFTPGTGLARNYPGPVGFIFRHLLPLFTRRSERVNSVDTAGEMLAALAVDPAYAGSRGNYFTARNGSLREVPPSMLARDDAACAKLWDDSAVLSGMTA